MSSLCTAWYCFRYRAMFALRNKGGPEAVDALAASFASNSALLKHEVRVMCLEGVGSHVGAAWGACFCRQQQLAASFASNSALLKHDVRRPHGREAKTPQVQQAFPGRWPTCSARYSSHGWQ